MRQLLPALTIFLAAVSAVYGQATAQGYLNLGPNAGLIVSSTPSLAKVGTAFGDFSGVTTLTYYIRTSQVGGSGSIQMKITNDFRPAGGPLAASGHLTYSCTTNNPTNGGAATPCTGQATASTTTQMTVTSFGPDARSSLAGDTASVQWSLKNDPAFKAGSYSGTVTFTISAN